MRIRTPSIIIIIPSYVTAIILPFVVNINNQKTSLKLCCVIILMYMNIYNYAHMHQNYLRL